MEPKEIKSSIRKEMLAKRDTLNAAEKAVMDSTICKKLEQVIAGRAAGVIHSYLPFGSEPDIYPLLSSLLHKGVTVICPKSLAKRTIQNLVLTSLDELEEGRYGTRHPASGLEYHGNIDLYIVPGVAFDHNHYRLGYGSGYYDNYFGANPGGHKVGICYGFQLVSELPNESHDIPLNQVIC